MAKQPTTNAAWTAELAARWDDARATLKSVTEAAAAAQAAVTALPAEASTEQRSAAEAAHAEAKAKVDAAQAVITELAKGPKPPKGGKPAAQSRPSQGAVQAGGGSAAPSRQEGVGETQLVAAIAVHDVRWNGRLFGPDEPLEPDLPQNVFDHLEADGAVRAAD